MSDLLSALRAAVRPATPLPATSVGCPPSRPVAGASRAVSVGPWIAPGSAPGSWGRLAPSGNHPHEADAIISLCEMQHGLVISSHHVALLRRRLHLVRPGDVDAQHLESVPLYELHSPNGRDHLSALHDLTLLEELASRLGASGVVRRDVAQ